MQWIALLNISASCAEVCRESPRHYTLRLNLPVLSVVAMMWCLLYPLNTHSYTQVIQKFSFAGNQCEWWTMNPPYQELHSFTGDIHPTMPGQDLTRGDILLDPYACPAIIGTYSEAIVTHRATALSDYAALSSVEFVECWGGGGW